MNRPYWRVYVAYWSDEKVVGWSDDAKLLGVYLLTCKHRTCEGLFHLPESYILGDLHWPAERLEEPLRKLLDDGFIEYDEQARLCLIVNALEYQSPENPNQVTAAIRFLTELPRSWLFARLLHLADLHCQRLAEGLRLGLPERLTEPFQEPLAKPLPKQSGNPSANLLTPPLNSSSEKKNMGSQSLALLAVDEIESDSTVDEYSKVVEAQTARGLSLVMIEQTIIELAEWWPENHKKRKRAHLTLRVWLQRKDLPAKTSDDGGGIPYIVVPPGVLEDWQS